MNNSLCNSLFPFTIPNLTGQKSCKFGRRDPDECEYCEYQSPYGAKVLQGI